MAVALGKLIYVIVDPDYTGHGNTAMFKLHPFIGEFAAQTFDTVPAAVEFLRKHTQVMSGRRPNFVRPEGVWALDGQMTLDEIGNASR
jgi:hypothetical protein